MEEREFLVLLHFVQPEIDLAGGLRRGPDFDSDSAGYVVSSRRRTELSMVAEKKQVLPVGRKGCDDSFDRREKAHVEHSVRLIFGAREK